MKVFVAIDSFKGSISSEECLNIASKTISNHDVSGIIISDGGEGFVEALENKLEMKRINVNVIGANQAEIGTYYGWNQKSATALLEVAQPVGITRIVRSELNPHTATSYGLGQQINDALNRGAQKIIIGLGGSSTNDGGIGMLMALGVRFYDKAGQCLTHDAFHLNEVERIDTELMNPALKDITFEVACDVTNPLLGDRGATYVFGPQKGIKENELAYFDEAMAHYANIVNEHVGFNSEAKAGAGAAGGIGFALYAFTNVTYYSGLDFIAKNCDLENTLKEYDLLITGEGRFDSQSLDGKVVYKLAKYAHDADAKTIVLCGSVEDDHCDLADHHIDAIVPIIDNVMELDDAIKNGPALLERTIKRVFNIVDLCF